jgi:hypothetical protein
MSPKAGSVEPTTSWPLPSNSAAKKSFFSRMKGDIAVRSISASISLCAARSAPRTISRVTGSQARAGSAGRASSMA